jgi:hypothetical protein
LTTSEYVTFSWQASGVSGPFSLNFSTSATAGKPFTTSNNMLTLTAEQLNIRLNELGIEAGTPVRWSVSAAEVQSASRLLYATRPEVTIQLLQPATGATVDLTTAESLVFEWQVTPAATELAVMLGLQPDLSDAYSLPVSEFPADVLTQEGAGHYRITIAATYFSMLTNLGGAYGPETTLYWTLIPVGLDLSTYTPEIRNLTLILEG